MRLMLHRTARLEILILPHQFSSHNHLNEIITGKGLKESLTVNVFWRNQARNTPNQSNGGSLPDKILAKLFVISPFVLNGIARSGKH